VVADEVRALAQRSALASNETANQIEGAINKNSQAGPAERNGGRVAQRDRGQGSRRRQPLERAEPGIEQINRGVGEMDKVTQSNASSAGESASATEELNAWPRS
jgi:methyl-accepting chemotaxis protein